jgi:hypothetical protein
MKLHINAPPSYGQTLSGDDQALFGPSVIGEVREYLAPLRAERVRDRVLHRELLAEAELESPRDGIQKGSG